MTDAGGPRIAPLPRARWGADALDLLGGDVPGGRAGQTSNFLTTLVRDPALLRLLMGFIRRLWVNSSIPLRDRELVVLRTTWLCQSPYAWSEHVRIAQSQGIDHADIQRVADGPDAAGWDEFDRAIVRAVDQLHATATVSDEAWQVLATRYTEEQLLEFPMLAGLYHLVSWTQNAAGIQPNPGAAGLAAR